MCCPLFSPRHHRRRAGRADCDQRAPSRTSPCVCVSLSRAPSRSTLTSRAPPAQDNIYYGLVRTTETIDQTEAVKFVFISFLGEKVAPMRKAKISTLKGTITEAFAPFHAELLNASWQKIRPTRDSLY